MDETAVNLILAASTGSEVDTLLARYGYPEPMAQGCHRCDFGSGQRGMDRCATCDGTGSVFRVGAHYYPNTEDGYVDAAKSMVRLMKKEEGRG